MGTFAVSAVGRDRPGIVAAITAGLLGVDGNVEDSRMTNLGGHFTVMLVVSVPDDQDGKRVEAALAYACEGLGLDALSVSELTGGDERVTEADHTITVYGSDRPGIVHSITAELASARVNITDLQTRLTGAAESPLYVMMLEVELGDDTTPAEVQELLREVAERSSVEVSIAPLEAEAL